jgi:hypothetical protein
VLNDRNVPLRLALAAAGFRAADPGTPEPPAGASGTGPAKAGAVGQSAGAVRRSAGAAGRSAGADPAGRAYSAADGQPVVYSRTLDGPLPALPGWLTGPAGPAEPGPDQPLPPAGGAP